MYHPFRLPFLVIAMAALLVAGAARSAAAPQHRYARTATVSARVTTSATASARVSVRTSAGAAVTGSATARSSATERATGHARRTAATPKKARARARAAALATARRSAYAKAHHTAYLRALAAARTRASTAAAAKAAAKAAKVAKVAKAAPEATAPAADVPSSAGATCQPVPGYPTCTFDDEFDGTTLDPTKWSVLTSAQTGLTMGDACFVDSPNNVNVSDGVLNLVTRKESTTSSCHRTAGDFDTQYTGAEVATNGKFSQQYGRFAVRAKFPATTIAGLQSTLWMWPADNYRTGHTGEIDITEAYSGYSAEPIPYVHDWDTATYNATYSSLDAGCTITDLTAFHEYAVEWTPSTITAYVDGKACLVDHVSGASASPFDQPYFLALSAGLGVGWNAYSAETPLPATTQIDWVRAWT